LLVRLHDFVPHLHHQLKGEIGFFDGNHGAVQIRAFAVEELRHLGCGIALPALDLIPWDAWGRAVKEAAPQLARVGYGEPEGLPELREFFAEAACRSVGLP